MNPPQGFGPLWLPHGGARLRLHAPGCDRVLLRLASGTGARAPARVMERDTEGGHFLDCPGCEPGDRYAFDVGDLVVPDPASRFQPEGVHSSSELIDLTAYDWHAAWQGRPWAEVVLCELHVGCFSDGGDYGGIERRLDHLADTGFTAIELMPLAQFSGRRGWGYDGVLPFAPHVTYGRGLAVLLDVVYNHFGPEGHYLPHYWPAFVDEDEHTPWGAAINYGGKDSRGVREFVFDNASYWLREFRFDGLRLDAVHAIRDASEPHLLQELATRLRREFRGRELHLVLENEHNDAALLARDDGAPRCYTAQWNDDVHHGLHVALTGEAEGYYADYHASRRLLPRALAEGFAFQGETMHSLGRSRGSPSTQLPPAAFVDFLQNHDQIGNRAFGERITMLAEESAVTFALGVLLLSPHVPLLFMGEEWGSCSPFAFFCDFAEPLASAVRDGRRREFAHFSAFRDAAARARIPDPLAESTFLECRLDWAERDTPRGQARSAFVRDTLALRRAQILPWLAEEPKPVSSWRMEGDAFTVTWAGAGRALQLRCNPSDRPVELSSKAGRRILTVGEVVQDRYAPAALTWDWVDG
jgi:maltooligosyltrehalose trehalohydrolase